MKIRIKFDGGKFAKPSGKFKDLNKLGAAPVGLLKLKERGFCANTKGEILFFQAEDSATGELAFHNAHTAQIEKLHADTLVYPVSAQIDYKIPQARVERNCWPFTNTTDRHLTINQAYLVTTREKYTTEPKSLPRVQGRSLPMMGAYIHHPYSNNFGRVALAKLEGRSGILVQPILATFTFTIPGEEYDGENCFSASRYQRWLRTLPKDKRVAIQAHNAGNVVQPQAVPGTETARTSSKVPATSNEPKPLEPNNVSLTPKAAWPFP